MPDEKPVFTILRVTEWNYVTSRVIGASNKPERDTAKAIAVKCNEMWRTFPGT